MMSYIFTKNHGFSLVETLVAISILLLVVTGPMSISMRTAKSTNFASEQVQAFFLAQEGLELAQKSRDDLLLGNFLPITNTSYIPNPWARFTQHTGTGIYKNCYDVGGCGMQWNTANDGKLSGVFDCDAAANTCLLYQSNSGRSRFTHTAAGNFATPFTRRINFERIFDGLDVVAVKVTSEVTWRTGSLVANQSVSTMTYLYNIYDLP